MWKLNDITASKEMDAGEWLFWKIILIPVGILIIYLSINGNINSHKRLNAYKEHLKKCEHREATVTAFSRAEVDEAGNLKDAKVTYEFKVVNNLGKAVTVKAYDKPDSETKEEYYEGEKVKIIYTPNKPNEAKLLRSIENMKVSLWSLYKNILVGVLVIIAGIALIILF
jgi:hypothetical protein